MMVFELLKPDFLPAIFCTARMAEVAGLHYDFWKPWGPRVQPWMKIVLIITLHINTYGQAVAQEEVWKCTSISHS